MIGVDELPDETRVKLEDSVTQELWQKISEEGIARFAERKGFKASKLYNWKNSDSLLPLSFLRELELDFDGSINALKGPGRGSAIKNPEIPLPIESELATRARLSVSVNRNGSPIYATDDIGNARRFASLLDSLGEDVPYRFYSRDRFEVHYAKFLHELLQKIDEVDLGAEIDEVGEIGSEEIRLPDRTIRIESFEGELYSRQKKLDLALARGDREQIEELLQEGARAASGFTR